LCTESSYLKQMSAFFRNKRNNPIQAKPDPVPSEAVDELLDELIKGRDLTADLIRMYNKVFKSYEKKVDKLLTVNDERKEESVTAYHALQEDYVDSANFEGATDHMGRLNEEIVRDIASVQQTWKHLVELKDMYVDQTKHIEPTITSKLDEISNAMANELGRRKTLYQNFLDSQRDLKQSIVLTKDHDRPRRSLEYPEGDTRKDDGYMNKQRYRDEERFYESSQYPRRRRDYEMKEEEEEPEYRPRQELRQPKQKQQSSRFLIKRPVSQGLATGFAAPRSEDMYRQVVDDQRAKEFGVQAPEGDELKVEVGEEEKESRQLQQKQPSSTSRALIKRPSQEEESERPRYEDESREDVGYQRVEGYQHDQTEEETDEQEEEEVGHKPKHRSEWETHESPMKEAAGSAENVLINKPTKAIDRATSFKNPLPGSEQREQESRGYEPKRQSEWRGQENPLKQTTDTTTNVLLNKPAKAIDRATSFKNPLPGSEQQEERESRRSYPRRESNESPYEQTGQNMKSVLIDKPLRAVGLARIPRDEYRKPQRGQKAVSSSSESDEEYERKVIEKYREQLEKRSPQKRMNPESYRGE
jgi:hypothetical protein